MKKIIALLLISILSFLMVACSSTQDTKKDNQETKTTSEKEDVSLDNQEEQSEEKNVQSNSSEISTQSNNDSSSNVKEENSKNNSSKGTTTNKSNSQKTENKSSENSSKDDKTTTHKHNYSRSVTNPTCTQGGFTTYTCSCGDSYKSDNTSAKGHTEVVDKAVEATTTSTGLTEGKHCSVCGSILVQQAVVPKKASPSENSTFQITKNDILKTYSSLYVYNEYSIEKVEVVKKDTSDSKFQITVTLYVTMLDIPEGAPDYIKGYWTLKKGGSQCARRTFTVSNAEVLELRTISFTYSDLEEGDYTLSFTSYI